MSASITMLRQGIRAERDLTSHLWTILNEMRLQRHSPSGPSAPSMALRSRRTRSAHIASRSTRSCSSWSLGSARMSKGLIARATSNGKPVSAR